MCGIVGFSGAFDEIQLKRGLDAIQHRGPDDWGVFLDPACGIGLGHARLSIIDLSPLGHQPMVSADHQSAIVFNGEIYNFQELRRDLEGEGHQFRGKSDTEVLLHLYQSKKEGMLGLLNGIFAFAIWNARDRTLFVARDALGVKPLYFSRVSRGFAFASEIKAILPLVPEARELDPAAINRYLTYLWCPGEGTPLKRVRKLGPGEAMIVRDGQVVRQWTWYQLPVFRGVEPVLTEKEAISSTSSILRAAVHRQMVSDVPVGAFLSGGLDSSAVVSYARELVPDIQCFTIESEGAQDPGMIDDLPYARQVAADLGVPLEVVRIDPHRMAADLEQMVTQLDEPLADPAPLNVLYICSLARANGVKVMLSGVGGDDLFTGYRRHAALQLEPLWRWLPKPVLQRIEESTSSLGTRNALFRRVAKLFRGASLEGDAHLAAYFTWGRRTDLLALYSPQFRREVEPFPAETPMLEFLEALPPNVSQMERMLALEQRFFLADHNLVYTDKMSMATGVEVRVPFLDLEVVQHAARVPAALKQRGRTSKWVLKKALEANLRRDVIYRRKSGFGAPLRRWMRHELRPLMEELLSDTSVARRGIFDAKMVRALILDNDRERVDGAYTLLSMMNIEIWCRAFIDSTQPVSAGVRPYAIQ